MPLPHHFFHINRLLERGKGPFAAQKSFAPIRQALSNPAHRDILPSLDPACLDGMSLKT
jgi:hypothetical protein